MVNDLDARSVRAEETLARLRVECVEVAQQLQTEILTAAREVEHQQRRLEDLEGRLTEVGVAAEAAAAARERAEQELARMRATLTWRLRDSLLRFGAVRLAVKGSRRVMRLL